MRTKADLKALQALPLDIKVSLTIDRIRQWVDEYGEDGVSVSFSGGKDSTVLLHLVRSIYPKVKAVFSNTGLEYPEIVEFVKTIDNVEWVKPKMTFGQVVTKYGYPMFSKEVSDAIWYARKLIGSKAGTSHRVEFNGERYQNKRRDKLGGKMSEDGTEKSMFNKQKYLPACRELPFLIGANCCRKTKEEALDEYQRRNHKKPFVATLMEESKRREQAWIRTGCNAFEGKKQQSKPLSFWTEQDILRYIKDNDIEIASIYGNVVAQDKYGNQYDDTLLPCGQLRCTRASRTGCMYCAYGAGYEHRKLGKSRFELLKEKHPQIYDYIMRGGQWVDNPYYDPTAPKVDPVDGWVNWNPKKIWVPSTNGLGLKFVFDEVNRLMPDYIKY